MTWPTASRLLRHPLTQGPLRAAAVAAWLAVAALALARGLGGHLDGLPGAVAPRLAVGLAALVTRLAFRFTRSRVQLIASVSTIAALELGRAWITGDAATLGGCSADATGVAIGIAIGRVIDHRSWQGRHPAPR